MQPGRQASTLSVQAKCPTSRVTLFVSNTKSSGLFIGGGRRFCWIDCSLAHIFSSWSKFCFSSMHCGHRVGPSINHNHHFPTVHAMLCEIRCSFCNGSHFHSNNNNTRTNRHSYHGSRHEHQHYRRYLSWATHRDKNVSSGGDSAIYP